jgi:hypothetical protein
MIDLDSNIMIIILLACISKLSAPGEKTKSGF